MRLAWGMVEHWATHWDDAAMIISDCVLEDVLACLGERNVVVSVHCLRLVGCYRKCRINSNIGYKISAHFSGNPQSILASSRSSIHFVRGICMLSAVTTVDAIKLTPKHQPPPEFRGLRSQILIPKKIPELKFADFSACK